MIGASPQRLKPIPYATQSQRLSAAPPKILITQNPLIAQNPLLRANSLIHPNCLAGKSAGSVRSPDLGEFSPQFVRGTEKRVLDCAFRSIQDTRDRPQSHSVIVLQFEYHSLAGGKPSQSPYDASSQLATDQAALGAGIGSMIWHPVQKFFFLAIRRNCCRQIATARILLAQVIEAEIRNDTVDPSIKSALKTKAGQIYVGAQERFLINVLTIFLRAGEMNRQAEDGTIILPNQFFEGRSVAKLGLADKPRIIHADGAASCHLTRGRQSDAVQDRPNANFASVRHHHFTVQPTNL
jgi:hypothetical protein